MASMAMIIRAAVVIHRIHGIARRRIVRPLQRHMTLAALNGGLSIAFVVPVAGSPVIILILQLHPANPVYLLVDELFVACRAILGRLVKSPVQAIVLSGPRANQKVACHRARGMIGAPLPEIIFG